VIAIQSYGCLLVVEHSFLYASCVISTKLLIINFLDVFGTNGLFVITDIVYLILVGMVNLILLFLKLCKLKG